MKKIIVMICKWINAGEACLLSEQKVLHRQKIWEKYLNIILCTMAHLLSSARGMTTDSLSFFTANRLQEL